MVRGRHLSLKPIRTKTRTGKASYASLGGNWQFGKKQRLPSKKKIVGLSLVVLLATLFLIGDYGPVPLVHADYNSSFTHTRTPIWSETDINLPITGITLIDSDQIAMVNFATCTASPRTFPAVDVFGTGDTILLFFFRIGAGFLSSVTDNKGNSYTSLLDALTGSGSGASISVWKATTVASGLTTITFSFASGCWGGVVHSYRGVSGFGDTKTNGSDAAADSGSSSLSLTLQGNNSTIAEAFAINNDGVPTTSHTYTITPNSGQTTRQSNGETDSGVNFYTWKSYDETNLSGSQTQMTSWSTVGGDGDNSFRHVAVELKTTGTSTSPDSSLVRWNFNSTCVELSSAPRAILFRYIEGTTGSGGKNCNSADIAITKTTINLQTISSRMLEMLMAIDDVSSTTTISFQMMLRTNGTLPRFSENYDPFKDQYVHLIWEACPNYSCARQTIYVSRKADLTINQQTKTITEVIRGPTAWTPPTFPELQTVLNFSGPTNFINAQFSGSNNSTSTGIASGLQIGSDYFIMLKANFDTTKAPCGGCRQHFRLQNSVGGLPNTFQIFSVPASCSDKVNFGVAGCANPTVTPTFDINPLDPRTWANALIKGLEWVFLVLIPTGFVATTLATVRFLQEGFNAIGNFFGWGNIGDGLATFLSSMGALLTGGLSTVTAWVTPFVNRSLDFITFVNTLFAPYLAGILDFLTAMKTVAGFIATIGTFLIFVGPSAYITIDFVFYFVFVSQDGLGGFGMWMRWNKWISFAFLNLATKIANVMISMIGWLIARVPALSGTHLPKFPHIEAGEVPSFKLDFGIPAISKGDATSVFLLLAGFTAFVIFLGSTSSPFSATSQAQISPLQNLFLPLITMSFLIMLFVLPLELMNRVTGRTQEF